MGAVITMCCKRRQQHEDLSETILVKSQEKKTEFSWEKRRAELNVKDYIIENQKGVTVGRTPGTVKGEQFIIQNCENCDIYIFDHIATVTVDDCSDCRIFLGPVTTSVFFRDCQRCKTAVSCQQFRVRDCTKLDVFLHCVTQPIIESSSGMRFGCLQFYYPELEGQYREAGLSVFNNNWGKIHDFTQVPGECNYSFLTQEANIEDYLPLPCTEQFAHMELSTDCKQSVVPLTLGPNKPPTDEPNLFLTQTLEAMITPEQSQRIFSSAAFVKSVEKGPVIGLQYNGHNVVRHIAEHVVDIMKGTAGLVYVSHSHEEAILQSDQFFSFGEMQMSTGQTGL